jgi:dTDP-4-dehydrorhamnose reductase
MKILLIGKSGQVAWELQRSLRPLGEVTAFDCPEIDLGRPESLPAIVRQVKPRFIVNAAAYTAVDKAESEQDVANRVNGDSVGVLAREAAAIGAWMVHYSTDYVFDGTGTRPWTEADSTNPVNAYGRSKLLGEQQLAASGCRHLLFRTSWVYAARGHNFVRTILRLAAERDSLRVIADQHGVPTSAELLADVTALALHQVRREGAAGDARAGTYHLVPRGETTWHGIAVAAVEEALAAGAALKCTPDRIAPIPTSEYPLPAVRPSNSLLSVDRVEQAFGIRCPDWRAHLTRTVTELLKGSNA